MEFSDGKQKQKGFFNSVEVIRALSILCVKISCVHGKYASGTRVCTEHTHHL
jgi:hypothetical protein